MQNLHNERIRSKAKVYEIEIPTSNSLPLCYDIGDIELKLNLDLEIFS